MSARRGSVVSALAMAMALQSGCNDGSPTTPELMQSSPDSCMTRAVFGEPTHSNHCLPFPENTATTVSQAYCSPEGRSHHGRFAYDFGCDLGDAIVAAQDGVVFTTGDEWPDDDPRSGHENRVLIRQVDGTMAFYAHFQQSSIPVHAGDPVTTGQLIGRCGSSGTPSAPHLHFEVFEGAAYEWDRGVAVNFSNADGASDSRGGLAVDQTYVAQVCS